MSKDFEVVDSKRLGKSVSEVGAVEGEVVDVLAVDKGTSGKDQLMGVVADNFDKILDIATSIVEIQNMKVKADTYIRELEEQRKMLETEADSYVKKLNAKTDSTVSKVEVIRRMMQDYYLHGKGQLSSEEFSKIIQDVIAKMGVSDE